MNVVDRTVLEKARSAAKKALPPITKMVPMRDGVCLATDVYLPEGIGPWTTIVERTPYNRQGVSSSEISLDDQSPLTRIEIANYYRDLGFAVVMQDVRGRYESEGEFAKYINEADDGFDAYSWIIDQDWSDGRLCTMGLSYGAHTQLAAACAGAPGISSMIIDTGGLLNTMKHSLRFGGAFELKQLTWMLRNAMAQAWADGNEAAIQAMNTIDTREAVFEGDWRPGKSPLSVMPEYEASLFEMWDARPSDPEWQSPATCAENWLDNFPQVPVLLVGSWNDPYATSMCELFEKLTEKLNHPVTTIMGPWLHGKRSLTHAGGVDFGVGSTLDQHLDQTMLETRAGWFRHVLDGKDNPFAAAVNLYQMRLDPRLNPKGVRRLASGKWIANATFPETNALWFDACSDAALVLTGSDQQSAKFEFHTDHKDPFPTLGGAITSGGELMQGGMFNLQQIVDIPKIWERPDVQQFLTPKLEQPIRFIGAPRVSAKIDVGSDDFDLVAWLCYCERDGSSEQLVWFNVTDGIQRVGKNADHITIKLMSSCFEFAEGAQIGLIVTTGNFPRFDLAGKQRMPGGPMEQAQKLIRISELQLKLDIF